jgi:hypothetical protein
MLVSAQFHQLSCSTKYDNAHATACIDYPVPDPLPGCTSPPGHGMTNNVLFQYIVLKNSIRVPRPRVMLKFRRGECSRITFSAKNRKVPNSRARRIKEFLGSGVFQHYKYIPDIPPAAGNVVNRPDFGPSAYLI